MNRPDPPQPAETDSRLQGYTEQEERIFKAALTEFSRLGKEGARMQEIADAAGVNKALVHYYFRSKDRLYEEVITYLIRKYFVTLGEAFVDSEDIASVLTTFIDRYIDTIEQNPDLPAFMMREIASGSDMLRKQIARFMMEGESAAFPVFFRRIQEASQRGEIRPVDPVHTFISIIGACVFTFITLPIISVRFPQMTADFPAYIAKRKSEIFNLLYHGLVIHTEGNKS